MRMIIDRFEHEQAICELEDGSFRRIPLSLLPADAKEGSVLQGEDGEFRLLQEETMQRQSKMAEKLSALLRKR